MPILILYLVIVLMESIVRIKAQNNNVSFLDFENDFGGWYISYGNWNRSTKNSDIKLWSSKSF